MKEFFYKNDVIEMTSRLQGYKPVSIMDNIVGTVFHNNYLDYLSKCYSSHNGIVIKPDYIWYTILCEIASIVKASPKTYQNIFTDSDEKKDVLVYTDDPVKMPIDVLINSVFDLIPSGLKKDDILLKFSTVTENSTFAFSTSFLDAVSPYYNYMMYMCGYNKIKVMGTVDDYQLMKNSFGVLTELFNGTPMMDYFNKVGVVIDKIMNGFEDLEFWKNIFFVKYCGSGHQETAQGWFTALFNTYPRVAYVENFPTHISVVKYKNITTGKSFEMSNGILSSVEEGDYLVPDFSFYINEQGNLETLNTKRSKTAW